MLPSHPISADPVTVLDDHLGGWRERLARRLGPTIASIAQFARAEAYYAVESSRRYQAVERRRQRGAARAAILVIVAAAAFDIAAFGAINGADAPLLIALNLGLISMALVGFLALRGWGRHHPDLVISILSLSIVATCAILGVLGRELAIFAIAYLLMLPGIVTLVVPARPWKHVVWLFGYAVGTFGFLVLAPATALSRTERMDVAMIATVAIVASFIGSVLQFRTRADGYMQFVAVQNLRHAADRDRRALSRARADLELAIRIDQLTEVGNRRRLREDLLAARARLDRMGGSFGLLELDLDRFKQVNDRFGHLVGDTVLRDVAAIFKQASRSTDVVYRFGGEEFIVLLPDADRAATIAAAERLRAAVESASIDNPGNAPTGVVTVSIGGAVIARIDLEQTDEGWLERADRSLYRAKTEGRNRVVMETVATAA